MPRQTPGDYVRPARASRRFRILRKALLRRLVHEIRVEARDAIHPVFRVPDPDTTGTNPKVRTQHETVGLTEQRTNPSAVVSGLPIAVAARHAKVRRDGYRM